MVKGNELELLRAAVKEECTRRTYNGSLSVYADDTEYGVTNAPAGAAITAAQGRAIVDPLDAIKDFGNLRTVVKGDLITSDFDTSKILSYVNELKQEPADSPTSSCRSACSGLCAAACSTSCNGCTGCSGGCEGGCSTSCSNKCAVSCGSNCASGCWSACAGGCMQSRY